MKKYLNYKIKKMGSVKRVNKENKIGFIRKKN